MKEFMYTITDPEGIHARPAGMLVKKAKEYTSKITIVKEDKSADALRLMAVMSLGVKGGMEVKVTAEGDDEDAAIAGMEDFFKTNL